MQNSSRYIPNDLFFAVLDRDRWHCVYCGDELFYDDDEEDDNVEIDHKIPFADGGPTVLNNLQATCGHCNARKGRKTDAQYRQYIQQYGVEDEDYGD